MYGVQASGIAFALLVNTVNIFTPTLSTPLHKALCLTPLPPKQKGGLPGGQQVLPSNPFSAIYLSTTRTRQVAWPLISKAAE